MTKVLAILAVLLGANMFASFVPFPDERLAAVYATHSTAIYTLTALFIPLVTISAGIAFFFEKNWSRIALVISFGWMFVIHVWAFVMHMVMGSGVAAEIQFRNELTWLLLGGIVLYALLTGWVIFQSRRWSQSNKSLKADALKRAA